MRKRLSLLLLNMLLHVSCIQREQWLVFIATDAPVPQLGDYLHIEITDESGVAACPTGCTNEIPVRDPKRWPISFGIAHPAEPRPLRVRASLYRADHVAGSAWLPLDVPLERILILPPADHFQQLGIVLAMNCLNPTGTRTPTMSCNPDSGMFEPLQVAPPLGNPGELPLPGSWPLGSSIPCDAHAIPESLGAELRCVSGGVFLMGAPRALPIEKDLQPYPQRLVRVSPFAIDIDEMTNKQYRQLRAKNSFLAEPVRYDPDFQKWQHHCTYGRDNDDDYPVNCISREQARQACRARHPNMRLPREAEWEYVAGSLDQELLYPWGDNPAICLKTVVARAALPNFPGPTECKSIRPMETEAPGPARVHAWPYDQDVTLLGIHNLAGNVSEWLEGAFAPYTDPCWTPHGPLLIDPSCPPAATKIPIRGGSWMTYRDAARVFTRQMVTSPDPANDIGFRCVLPM